MLKKIKNVSDTDVTINLSNGSAAVLPAGCTMERVSEDITNRSELSGKVRITENLTEVK